MYLHLGNQVIALQKSVIGVFDMDTATWSHRTRETLEKLEQAGQMITGSCGLFHSGSFPAKRELLRKNAVQRLPCFIVFAFVTR